MYKMINKTEIEIWLEKFKITKYKIYDDLTVDVYENVQINDINIQNIPIMFNKVYGDFICFNLGLTTLKGCPKIVLGSFSCANNNLDNLQYLPLIITKDLYLHNNKLTSLIGCPKEINGTFICSNNLLTSLQYMPEKNIKTLYCQHNKLLDLKYAPEIISGDFDCSNNKITDFCHIPKKINGFCHIEKNNFKEEEIYKCHLEMESVTEIYSDFTKDKADFANKIQFFKNLIIEKEIFKKEISKNKKQIFYKKTYL